MFEIDERVRRPQSLAQLLARDDDAGMFEENLQKTERLFGQRDSRSTLCELAGPEVELEVAETRTKGR